MVKVAIAEDDFRIADIHAELVDKIDGFSCVGKALNAQQTRELLKETDIDILLLDIFMPDELGTELLSMIRDTYPEVDIIIITASNDEQHIKKSLRYGVFDYILKPVSPERLKSTLHKYKVFCERLKFNDSVTQKNIDQLTKFGEEDSPPPTNNDLENVGDLPKGIDALSLQTVCKILDETESGITADEMGKRLGASRTTARRYLEYLISTNKAVARPIYGIVGRPERRYFAHH